MILLNFRKRGRICLGIKTSEGVVDVETAVKFLGNTGLNVPRTIEAVLRAGRDAVVTLDKFLPSVLQREIRRSCLLSEDKLQLCPPIPNPGKIICIGLNYRCHAAESGMAIPEHPVVFSKFNNSIAAAGEPIPLPSRAAQFDYEAELGVVIGQEARAVRPEEALNCVLGYVNTNDLSARDLQCRTSQWLLGKSIDKFLPVGPYLVTADQVSGPQNLSIQCWVNGELRQNSNTSGMIFSVAELISYLSQYMSLQAGDLICTGTPQGVIFGRKEKNWLKPGDCVTVKVEGLGELTNLMAGGS